MSIPQSGGGPIESFDQLAAYMEAGCKPRDQWRIGAEHEKFGWLTDSRLPLPYSGDRSISAIFAQLEARYGWQPLREGENVIGLTRNGANISLEPGGQFELSGAPLVSSLDVGAELQTHLDEVRSIADPMGVRFMGIGAPPEWTHDQMPVMPKGRYRLMTDYMGRVGTHGTQMMYRTCTVQVNLDYGSEADFVKKLRVALALQPVATALFANSPFTEGKPNGYVSYRSRIWEDTDPDRTGMLPFVFEDGMGFERYTEYMLNVPMYFVYRDGVYINAAGQSFRDFLAGRLPAFPGERPTIKDWEDHLTVAFPEVRLKRFLEMRGADGGPWGQLCALPAFWVGLLYHQPSLDAAWDMARDWCLEERLKLRHDVPRLGLNARVCGQTVQEMARELINLSEAGLQARNRLDASGANETSFLQPLRLTAESGKTPAEIKLDRFNTSWAGSVDPVFTEFAY